MIGAQGHRVLRESALHCRSDRETAEGTFGHLAHIRRSRWRARHPPRHGVVPAALGTDPGALVSPDHCPRTSLAPLASDISSGVERGRAREYSDAMTTRRSILVIARV